MKNNVLKRIIYLAGILMLAVVVFVSCDRDDGPDTPPILVEDGVYVKGGGTAVSDLHFNGLMRAAVNEADDNNARAGMYEIYIAVRAGSEGFHISKVTGGTETIYGPGSGFGEVPEEDRHNDEPRGIFMRGPLAQTQTAFTVPEDGLYHISFDEQLNTVIVAKVVWGLVGAATPGGWGSNSEMTADFDLERMVFSIEGLEMENAQWKFRYSNGWKAFMDPGTNDVAVNTNFGGAVNNLQPGGADIIMSDRGVYTYTITWELGQPHTATEQKTGELAPPPEYPDAMYVVGAATAYGWHTPGEQDDAIMHKIAGGPANAGIFWKILHLEAGEGFKISAANWTNPNLNHGDVDEWDGITVSADGNDWTVAQSGMYMVVLNLQGDQVRVSVQEPEVYGMGDAFGGWDAGVEANKFVVDNAAKTLTSPPLTADGNIRMYADHEWIPDWWQAEFNVFDGVIEYRGDGGDQTAVPGTTGQVITLNFDDNTGSIQ